MIETGLRLTSFFDGLVRKSSDREVAGRILSPSSTWSNIKERSAAYTRSSPRLVSLDPRSFDGGSLSGVDGRLKSGMADAKRGKGDIGVIRLSTLLVVSKCTRSSPSLTPKENLQSTQEWKWSATSFRWPDDRVLWARQPLFPHLSAFSFLFARSSMRG